MTSYFFPVPVTDFTCVFAQMRSEKPGKRKSKAGYKFIAFSVKKMQITDYGFVSCFSACPF
jgi:hypothetical protein